MQVGTRPRADDFGACATEHGLLRRSKQIASGPLRCDPGLPTAVGGAVEIKVARGPSPAKAAASPGEGGRLYIAGLRNSKAWCGPDFCHPRPRHLFH